MPGRGQSVNGLDAVNFPVMEKIPKDHYGVKENDMEKRTTTMKVRVTSLVLGICALSAGSAWAAPHGWKFELTPYVWAAGIDGDIEVNGRKVDADMGFEDLVDKVSIGGSFLAVIQKGRWVNWLQVDYLGLSDDENVPSPDATEVNIESDTLYLTAATGIQVGLWREGQTLDIMGGIRYVRMDNELTISGVGSFDETMDIYDGVLVLRPSWPLSERWRFNPTLSIGAGDSDLTYELQPQFQFNFTETWAMRIGYRRLYYDSEGSRGNSFDGAFHGFFIGFGGMF
jgi:hypothetical protein